MPVEPRFDISKASMRFGKSRSSSAFCSHSSVFDRRCSAVVRRCISSRAFSAALSISRMRSPRCGVSIYILRPETSLRRRSSSSRSSIAQGSSTDFGQPPRCAV